MLKKISLMFKNNNLCIKKSKNKHPRGCAGQNLVLF